MDGSNSPVPLTSEACWALLSSTGVGRVAYSDRALPAIASVAFAVEGEHILLLVGENSAQFPALRDTVIAFQAEQSAHVRGQDWSVSCVGKAVPFVRPAHGTTIATTVLAIDPDRLEGRLVRPLPLSRGLSGLPTAAAG